jgi:hypothetical protein
MVAIAKLYYAQGVWEAKKVVSKSPRMLCYTAIKLVFRQNTITGGCEPECNGRFGIKGKISWKGSIELRIIG